MDAGTGTDAGTGNDGGAGAVMFGAIADATVWSDGNANNNFGADATLWVQPCDPKCWTRAFFVKFDVQLPSGSSIVAAHLVLNALSADANGISVWAAPTGWTETGITWNNAPPLGANPLSIGAFDAGVVDLDVTGLVAAGLNAFEVGDNGLPASFSSREAGAGVGPRLVVTLTDGATMSPPPPPTDAGTPPPAHGTATFAATADAMAWSDGNANTNYGAVTTLWSVPCDSSCWTRDFYAKFDVALPSGATVASAHLLLNALSADANGVSVWATSAAWTETGLTWNNAPAIGDNPASSAAIRAGAVDVDATGLVAAGVNSLAITDNGTAGSFSSREAGATLGPRLVVTW